MIAIALALALPASGVPAFAITGGNALKYLTVVLGLVRRADSGRKCPATPLAHSSAIAACTRNCSRRSCFHDPRSARPQGKGTAAVTGSERS